MPYAVVYQAMDEVQKEKERARARAWHKVNYANRAEKKRKQVFDRYHAVGKQVRENKLSDVRYRMNILVNASRTRAKKSNIPHTITTDYIHKLYEKQDGKCCLSGREFDFTKRTSRAPVANALSIDRIVPALGYIEGNVRLIVHHLNMALSSYGEEALFSLIEDVRSNRAK